MSLERWDVQPAPTARDPKRHMLYLQGDMKDVLNIIKKFGALCGRPDRDKGREGFNYRMYLHRVTPVQLENLSAFLVGLAPAPHPAVEAAPEIVPDAEPSFPPEVTEPLAPAPLEESPAEAPEEPLIPELPPVPVPEEIPELPAASVEPMFPAAVAPPSLIPLASVGSPAAPEPAAAPVPVKVSAPAPVVPAAALPVAAVATGRPAKVLWGLEIALNEKRNMDVLLVGSFNRFAHAAATSTVSSPGTMYNPLFVHGGVGVGKTQMMHAIGNGLAKSLSSGNVLMTSGVRLSTAASLALAEGKSAELEEVLGKKKALVIDDAHLISITSDNQPFLAKIFAMFLGKNLQVVVSSLYPPRALSGLEEALKISFGKGWAVDMKIPNADTQKDMLVAGFSLQGVDVTTDEIAIFHEKLGGGYSESVLWMRRFLALKHIQAGAGSPTDWDALLKLLFQVPVGAEGDVPSAADIQAAKDFRFPEPDASAENLAVAYPSGQEGCAVWCLSKFYAAHDQMNFPRTYRHVLFHPYDAEQPLGVPFQIGEACRAAGADAVLVLGPPATSKLAERLNEFSHALRHVMSGLDISIGWIPFSAMTFPAHYGSALLDLHARRIPAQ